MVRIIFTLLSGLSVIFMVYVMAQFWKEGHSSRKSAARQHNFELPYMDRSEVLFVTQPISLGAQGGVSVMPMEMPERTLGGLRVHRDSANRSTKMPSTKRIDKSGRTQSAQPTWRELTKPC
jgi:hypothetical protein